MSSCDSTQVLILNIVSCSPPSLQHSAYLSTLQLILYQNQHLPFASSVSFKHHRLVAALLYAKYIATLIVTSLLKERKRVSLAHIIYYLKFYRRNAVD